jgi:hypothetical protein
MSCNRCLNNCVDPNVCDCNCKTTTTTCYPVAEKPCVKTCDNIFLTDCIIYDGNDYECYGVKKGDKVYGINTILGHY